VENFAKEFFALQEFEREDFVLSSGECVTAARVVQKISTAKVWCKWPVPSGNWRSATGVLGSGRAAEVFFTRATSGHGARS
jgi:hypothetical protein